VKQNKR